MLSRLTGSHFVVRKVNTGSKVNGLSTPPETPSNDDNQPFPRPWQEVSAMKKSHRDAILTKYSMWRNPHDPYPYSETDPTDVSQTPLDRLSRREKEIVKLDATALVDSMRLRRFSAAEVLTAFFKAAVAAQELNNCLTEIFYEEGLVRAKELDDHLARTGQVVGPLHGLPVSIKDHILIRGLDTSTGYISWAGKRIADRDAVVVDILRRAGAVLYVKTANPQTLLCLETNNNIFGRTVNPFNRTLSPGGSSGGESSLIASSGSPLGVGTDIGGSIRIPAAYTGLYGFKPSVARLPHAGLLGSHDGMDNIIGVVGPLARSARDLALFCSSMLHYEPWLIEAPVLNMPWKDDVARGVGLPEKLSFAILWDDGVVAPHPPIQDALLEVQEALLAAGHEVIKWEPLQHQASWDLITKLYFLDGGEEYEQTLRESGEPAVPGTQWILQYAGKPNTVSETFKLNLEREAFRSHVLAHWNASKDRTTTGRPVDGIICPIAATLAVPHDKTRWWGYSSYWNLVDYPAVVFPTGQLKACYLPKTPTPPPRNEVEKEIRAQWDPERYQNAPISLQLVGRRHQEEKVLAMLDVVEKALSL